MFYTIILRETDMENSVVFYLVYKGLYGIAI